MLRRMMLSLGTIAVLAVTAGPAGATSVSGDLQTLLNASGQRNYSITFFRSALKSGVEVARRRSWGARPMLNFVGSGGGGGSSSAVPEPTAALAFGAGAVVVGLALRRRRES